MSVAALLFRGAVCVSLAVRALAVRAGVALSARAVVRCTSLLAVVATYRTVEVTDGANRNSVSAVSAY